MKSNKLLKAILFLIAIFTLTQCGKGLKRATGSESTIYVLADSIEYLYYEPVLYQIFAKTIYTPRREQLFDLKLVRSRNFKKYKEKRNILVISALQNKNPVSDFIKSMLDSTVLAKVKSDSVFVFNKHDVWAKDQMVMILTSPTPDQLKMNMLTEHENLLYYFKNASDKRVEKALFNASVRKEDIEAKMWGKHNFYMYVQADFFLNKDVEEDNFVWLWRDPFAGKEQWIFIHWIDDATPALLNKDSVYTIRNKITKKYFQLEENQGYVQIADDFLTTEEVNFNGKYALLTQGLWRFTNDSGGGPFINYTFYDEHSKRIYMIDGAVFAPKFKKRGILQQLDVILKTFRVKEELSQQRIDELNEKFKEIVEEEK